MSTSPWLVVGIGNPGPQYAGNRHNAGAMAADVLASRIGSAFTTHKARAAVVDGRLGTLPGGVPGPRVIVAKPATYVNLSGGPVAALSTFYDIPAERLLVVYDELDLPAHTLRLKLGGGEGGHNGLRSISAALGTRDYVRLRIGIGRPPGRQDPADFVLRDFSAAERVELGVTLEQAADAVEDVVVHGHLAAQGRLHTSV
ncbi:peptidyl-tRNA hydrolase [Beutenbergia cavernae DSM 12333]|uniref:Peptidyl-tRNA hydrolase n=1 Tax=Beutenbergia cavernae (strain ATCC BAA-8 / DSM 12333 / CCUG 43141 / JCM 11478 / NBRC 16432 / NCIMB 13614 / HKI 0122) TaxID=471853 RepID=C5C065_BEUC1|nr:aminoacyl-tRNA hydrolase [Beutenbergia cavernae]ACQ79251.1 peptidyl-tRNA hydrolase [Beutenbergia cavernae DSM 12333]